MFTNTTERTRLLFMFVHLTNRTKFLVRVRSFIKRTNINKLPAEQFTSCSLNVRFVYSPKCGTPNVYIINTVIMHAINKTHFGFDNIMCYLSSMKLQFEYTFNLVRFAPPSR
ncbi:hypothetical protein Hanom_Chr04g00308031 [Helianthus anomalus]